jgi:leucyl aminopeptidase
MHLAVSKPPLAPGRGREREHLPALPSAGLPVPLCYLKSRSIRIFCLPHSERRSHCDNAQEIAEEASSPPISRRQIQNRKRSLGGPRWLLRFRKAAAEKGLAVGKVIAESQNFTRDLVNEPSNVLTPRVLAEKAQVMAKEAGLAVDILDEKRIAELKMGAILSVAQGSAEPPRMIVITYTPANAKPDAPVIGLVGKAVTFDTGGISIKPADGMEKMKYDMAGGARCLGPFARSPLSSPTSK